MKYQIIKNLHNDFSVFEKNKLSPRAYAIPYTDKNILLEVDPIKERYSSDMVTVLSGEWDFRFYKSIKSLPDKLDTLKVKFDTVNVPSDWQRTGHEEPVYLNCPYQFKTFAPDVPEDMPVGVYRKIFELESVSAKEIITFLGVANNINLYVNGKFAGYSEGSHNSAEFDITDLLKVGTNELLCVSFKWCNGSFLEAQDMFRDNGIFRDVLLYNYNSEFIYDYQIDIGKKENGYFLSVTADTCANTNAVLKASLYDMNGKEIANAESSNGKNVDFGILDVKEWNAELPVCYKLILTLVSDGKEIMSVRNITGFKNIRIDKNVFLFNDKPIKCKGVNHHDTDLYKGYAMSLDDMERDIRTMKSLNVNTVRTSHYPPDPFFLTLADIYGIYIVDEADIETHGCSEMYDDVSHLSMDLKWASHYVDRVKRMYFRDRNHPCLLMWSLGNESGGYKCHDKCYEFLKSTGTEIPVHYEGVSGTKRRHYDVISEMYTDTYSIEEMMQGKRKRWYGDKEKVCKEYSDYPFFLCEYCHAMGVGPGNLEEYFDLFYEWENSMGGCIWEWADHTVYHADDDKKYKYRYTYGGDHGEKQHDGHFCVDGLMFSDRTPHTGAKEMKVVYRPLRASYAGTKLFCFENTNRFRNSDYISIEWALLENGTEVDSGLLNTAIAPMQAECFAIDHKEIDYSKDCLINFTYKDKADGHVIAVEQLTLNDVEYEYDIEIGSKITAESNEGIVSVIFENGTVKFDGRTGEMISYFVNGEEILNTVSAEKTGFNPNLFRAVIDNDSRNIERWKKSGLDKMKKELDSFDVYLDDGEVDIVSVYMLKAGRKHVFDFVIEYTISSFGAVEVYAELLPCDGTDTDIPRFGITLELDKAFDDVRYYGRGDAENMPDFKCQAPVGIYSAKVDDMFEKYVFPQESGMHCDTKWIELSGKCENTLSLFADTKFNFSIHHFTQNAVQKATHQEELKKSDTTFLTLDGFTRGIGSSSCGPDTRDEYKHQNGEPFVLSFTIIPSKG